MKRFFPLLLLLLVALPTTLAAQQRYTVSGSVMDSASHETLLGATIYESGSALGTATNEYGFFSLTLPEGDVRLEITYVGYAPLVKELRLTADTHLNIYLDAAVGIEQVVVYGDRRHSGALSAQMGAIEVPIAQLSPPRQSSASRMCSNRSNCCQVCRQARRVLPVSMSGVADKTKI